MLCVVRISLAIVWHLCLWRLVIWRGWWNSTWPTTVCRHCLMRLAFYAVHIYLLCFYINQLVQKAGCFAPV